MGDASIGVAHTIVACSSCSKAYNGDHYLLMNDVFMKTFNVTSLALLASAFATRVSAAVSSTCSINGETVPCEQVAEVFENFGIVAFILFALGIALFVFWIMMIVHAVKRPIEHKALWIIVLLVGQGLGAVIYYFAVKRPFDASHVLVPVAPATPATNVPPQNPPVPPAPQA